MLVQYYKKGLVGVVVFSAILLSACGNPSKLVTGAALSLSGTGEQTMANVSVDVNTSGLNLPAFQLPILNPKQAYELLGSLSASPISQGSRITVSVNLNAVSKIQDLDGHYLPNGFPVPMAGLSNIPIVGIPIGNTGSVVYVAIDQKNLIVGSAIGIKEFSTVSQYVGGLNFFPSFTLANGVKGVAGIYTSQVSSKNGIAFFIDATSLLPKIQPQLQLADYHAYVRPVSISASSSQERKLTNGLAEVRDRQRGRPVSLSN